MIGLSRDELAEEAYLFNGYSLYHPEIYERRHILGLADVVPAPESPVFSTSLVASREAYSGNVELHLVDLAHTVNRSGIDTYFAASKQLGALAMLIHEDVTERMLRSLSEAAEEQLCGLQDQDQQCILAMLALYGSSSDPEVFLVGDQHVLHSFSDSYILNLAREEGEEPYMHTEKGEGAARNVVVRLLPYIMLPPQYCNPAANEVINRI